jgi:hypothetical protein
MSELLDNYLPKFEKREYHQLEINTDPDKIYRCIENINLKESFVINLLFSLRGLNRLFSKNKQKNMVNGLQSFTENGFILLNKKPGHHIVLGLIGKFWTIGGALKTFPASDFINYNEIGYARAAWSFEILKIQNGRCLVSTETRIHCPDKRSQRKFSIYWALIQPFSGLIRKEMLRLVKKSAEKSK